MLTTDDFDISNLSPIKFQFKSNNNNESFDLINLNDSIHSTTTTTPPPPPPPSSLQQIKSTSATRFNSNNDEMDDLLEVNGTTNDSEEFW